MTKSASLDLGLSIMFLTYLIAMFGEAMYDIFAHGPLRIVWLPLVNASAYNATVVTYCVVGFWLFRSFRWKAVIPIGLIGIFQEATWNFGYFTLYPYFPALETFLPWVEYTLVLVFAAPVLVFFQRKWFRVQWRGSPLVLVFPIYFVVYYLLGMPTALSLPGTVHAETVLFEWVYVLACALFYLAALRLELRSRGAHTFPSTKLTQPQ